VFSVWNIKAFIDSIPREYDEAALVDGAGHSTIMTKIILPLCVPAIAANAFLSFLLGWNEYIFAMTFLATPERFPAPVGLWSLQSPGVIGDYAVNWPLFAAGSVIVSVPAIAASFFFLRNYSSTMSSLSGR
jgi:arabinogalactan oligomer/maltooligosaccharide transport system permease protein